MIANTGNRFSSFKGGNLYLHSDASVPNNFFNSNSNSYVDIISNANANVVKQWLTMGVKTDAYFGEETDFEVVDAGFVDSEIEDTLPSGVVTSDQYYSSVSKLKFKEQQLQGAYLKSVKSGNNLVEGKNVKGFWNRTRLKINGGTNKIYNIFSISFKYILSNWTK